MRKDEVQDWENPGCGKDVVRFAAYSVVALAALIVAVISVGQVMAS